MPDKRVTVTYYSIERKTKPGEIAVSKSVRLIIAIGLTLAVIMTSSCNGAGPENEPDGVVTEKASSQLISQITMREQQLAEPTDDRLEIMINIGMQTEDIGIQKVYIYSAKRLSDSQVSELVAMGITPYPDTWIPPVGAHPAGFISADMPVDKLDELVVKDYVVRLDTAETVSQPLQPGVEDQQPEAMEK
jgi:hypothetical protein